MNGVSASRIFEFLEASDTHVLERVEISSEQFLQLRRDLRQILVRLSESSDGDGTMCGDRLRALLAAWLTVPVDFEDSMARDVADVLGPTEAVSAKWGSDIAQSLQSILEVLPELASRPNPLRVKLAELSQAAFRQGERLRIYCHRQARGHFEAALESVLPAHVLSDVFLHSVRDYRLVEPFDRLVKVGPLRSRGWSAAPDAIVSAPRFVSLTQIVWEGLSDESDFGYDPASSAAPTPAQDPVSKIASSHGESPTVQWLRTTQRSESQRWLGKRPSLEEDEFALFRELDKVRDLQPAVLIQVDDDHGVLYPPQSRILSFDPAALEGKEFELRVPSETLIEGMYIINPIVGEVDLGAVHAQYGEATKRWKNRLRLLYEADPLALVNKLRLAGMNLLGLHDAIRHWCNQPTSVVHAPQKREHFRILTEVLGLDDQDKASDGRRSRSFWRVAWEDIRRSRGAAIQAGFQEHELIDEQILILLSRLAQAIRSEAKHGGEFQVEIPPDADLRGVFHFVQVRAVDHGYRAPSNALRRGYELSAIDQWQG